MPEPAFSDKFDNPYAAPRSSVADVGETRNARLFSAKGRIGRSRYLFWLLVFNVAIYVFSSALIILLVIVGVATGVANHHDSSVASLVIIIIIAMMAVQCWVSILLTIQRSHDMGWTGWTCLIFLFVPFAAFVWIFNPGTRDANLYGPPPAPTPLGMKIIAIGLPVFCIIMATGFIIFGIVKNTLSASH